MWKRTTNRDDIDHMVDDAVAGTYDPHRYPPEDDDLQTKLAELSSRRVPHDPEQLRAAGYSIVDRHDAIRQALAARRAARAATEPLAA